MQPNQPTTVDSVQNKELLWTTLQESGAFAGFPSDRFQLVYAEFEKSVQQASKSMNSLSSLSDVNKHIIRQFMQSLRSTNANAIPIPNQNQNQNNAPKKKKIEMVYRAEDLQSERAGEFERQLREKQAEMDSFLTLKKPTDVSFTDAGIKEDKPIGDEMSRLIAQEMAARERELVQLKPEDIKKAQQWIGATNPDNESNTPPNGVKKSVSFSNTPMMNRGTALPDGGGLRGAPVTPLVEEMKQYEPNEKMNEFSDGEKFEETISILSKFKMIREPLTDTGLPEPTVNLSVASSSVASSSVASSSVASSSMQQLYNKLLDLEESMNARHAEIMARLKRA